MRVSFLLSLALLLPCRLAAAQPSDAAAAQSLFDSAKQLMKEGKFAEACAKLERSQALDPAGGTLLHLANCREQEGRLASAWAHYNEALSAARRDRRTDREEVASQKVKDLGPRLARLTIVVEGPVEGLEVKRGGALVDRSLWDTALPVDRGEYAIDASAPGHVASSQKVLVEREGESVTVKIAPLERVAAAAPAVASAAPAPAAAPQPERPPPQREAEASADGSVKRTAGVVMMGAGAVAAVAGGVFGFLSLGQKQSGDEHCTFGASADQCDDEGFDAREKALAYGNVSTVLIPAGLLVGGVGAFLFLTAPAKSGASGRSPAVRPLVGSGLGGVELNGVF